MRGAGPTEAIEHHLEMTWPGRAHTDERWAIRPISVWIPTVRVRRLVPRHSTEPWTHVTIGAWRATAGHAHAFEFVLDALADSPEHVETLTMLANLHGDPASAIHMGSIVEIGRPWTGQSESDHALLVPPYRYGPDFGTLVLSDLVVEFLWVVPITPREAEFAGRRGVEALEERFEISGLDMIDPSRPSVV